MPGQVLEIDCEAIDRALPALQRLGGFDEIALYGALIHVVAEGIAGRQDAIAGALRSAGAGLRGMTVIDASLEDAFISTAKRRAAEG